MCSVSLPGGEEVSDSAPVSGQTSGGDLQPADQESLRIIGGDPAHLPFLASIGTATQHACHGTLIDPQFLWTTADCAK